MNWNYISNKNKSNGYEDIFNELLTYTSDKFNNTDTDNQDKMINDVFKIYRNKNIFPIIYYNQDGIKNEIKRCLNKEVLLKNNSLSMRTYQGNALLRFLFPNFFQAYSGDGIQINGFDKFNNDNMLKEIIRFTIKHHAPIPSRILSAMNLYRTRQPTNFNPMRAKALYEKYCPKNGLIYDFACGYGGRMLGALTSKNNYKYFGVEPNTETFDNLNILGKYIEEVTDRKNIFKIYNKGSEDLNVSKENFVDFAFSSPPYFNLEKYCNEETQCYVKYPVLEDWFDKYVEPTIQNIYSMLKESAYYAVNIADFKTKDIKVNFVDRWIEISERNGFDFVEQVYMKLQKRGIKSKGSEESIYIFKKINKNNIDNYKNRKVPRYMQEFIKEYQQGKEIININRQKIFDWFVEFAGIAKGETKSIENILNNINTLEDVIFTINEMNNILKTR
jgi:hypothetical protein